MNAHWKLRWDMLAFREMLSSGGWAGLNDLVRLDVWDHRGLYRRFKAISWRKDIPMSCGPIVIDAIYEDYKPE